MNKLLQKIANTLLINVQNITSLSLFEGKMGVIVFFYHYGQFSKQGFYTEFADGMIDEIFEIIHKRKIHYLSLNELFEIGIVINHLFDESFVEGDKNDVLSDIDKILLRKSIVQDLRPNPAKMMYLLNRLKWEHQFSKNLFFKNLVEEIIQNFMQLRLEVNDGECDSLLYSNHILQFLLQINGFGIDSEIIKNTVNKVFEFQNASFLIESNVDDLLTFSKQCATLKKLLNINPPFQNFFLDVLDSEKAKYKIEDLWQNLLFFDREDPKIEIDEAQLYYETVTEDFNQQNFVLKGGLTGLGLGLLKQISLNTNNRFNFFI